MTTSQAQQAIKEAGGDWAVFEHWMRGQTVGVAIDGSTEYYDCDVERFIRYKCNPDNEPINEFD